MRALFSFRKLAALIAAVSLCGVVGCNSNDILNKVDNSTDHLPPAVSRSEVIGMTKDAFSRVRTLLDEQASALGSITDDASANAAIERIEKAFDDYKNSTQTKQVWVEMTNEEYASLEQEAKQLAQEMLNPQEFEQRFKALEPQIRGANLSMGTRMRFQTLRLNTGMLGTRPPFLLQRRYPPNQIATVVIENTQEASEFCQYLDNKLNLELANGKFANGVHQIRFGAVDDLEAFANRIDLGKVVRTNHGTRAILVELSAADLQMLQESKKKREEEQARLAKEQLEKAEATRIAEEREREQRVVGEVQSALAERDQLLSSAVRTLQRVTTPQSARDSVSTLEDIRRDMERHERGVTRALEGYRRDMNKDYEYEDKSAAAMAEIQTELDRVNKDPMMRVIMMRSFGQNLDAAALLGDSRPSGGYSNPSKDPSHPDYLIANLVDVKYGSSFERRDALKRLGAADPSQLKDRQMQAEIARAARDIVVAGSSHEKTEAIAPLVVWGGKFSVPIMLKLLEEEEGRGHNSDEIFAALAMHPTPESATAVSQYVGNFFAHDEACRCLVKMGSVAEDAVMKIAPSNEPKVSVAAVMILGEIGTEKSLTLLRQAVKSRNENVKAAAKNSIDKITARTK